MCLGVTSNKGGAILGTSNQGSLKSDEVRIRVFDNCNFTDAFASARKSTMHKECI
jgi:hypothetical protein